MKRKLLFFNFLLRRAFALKWLCKQNDENSPKRWRHDTWFRVIWIRNHLLKMAAVIGFSFKERSLRFQLLFPDFYHFHHVIWRMKWAKKLKTKNGQNMLSGPFSHDATHMKNENQSDCWISLRSRALLEKKSMNLLSQFSPYFS